MGRNSLRGTARIDIGFNFAQHFLKDLFLAVKDIKFPSYADDNTI